MKELALILVIAFSLLVENSTQAQAFGASDFNSDTYSDITIISIGGDQSLAWSTYDALGSLLAGSSTTLGQAGNNLAIANWGSQTIAQRGLLSLSGSTGQWTVLSDLGQASTRNFGGPNDIYISGADFNGNGFADAVVVRKPKHQDAEYTWHIRPDFFKDVNGGPAGRGGRKSLRFGNNGSIVFFANPGARGDWLAVLRANPSGTGSLIELKNLANGKSRRFRVADFSYANIRPLPLRQQNGRDILALAKRQDGNTLVKFKTLRGQSRGEVTLPGTGELLVGNFMAAAGQEIAIQTGSGFLVHNPLTGEEASIGLPDGIAIDDVNITAFVSEPEAPSCENETLSPNDGTDKFLWKPKGLYSGTLRVLLPQIYTGHVVDVVLLKPTGEFIERAHVSYDASNPNARTFASFTKPGGAYPANVNVVATLDGGCTKTYVIPHPSQRTD